MVFCDAGFRVDPRERGGSASYPPAKFPDAGRSPRARGKRDAGGTAARPAGSIPASAGEAGYFKFFRDLAGVDPRERGGSRRCNFRLSASAGRSPRARGKRVLVGRRVDRWGSIPASAGEALRSNTTCKSSRVDPRERGGSQTEPGAGAASRGRSPRARGKRESCRSVWTLKRSIPASAGEASTAWTPEPCARVDPRERGGSCTRAMAAPAP